MRDAKQFGAQFLSTTYFSEELVKTSLDEKIPMLVGVRTLKDCIDAVAAGASWLKVYPVSQIPIAQLTEMCQFVQTLPHSCRISLSGGIDSSNILTYQSLYAHDILKGYDLEKWTINNVDLDLKSLQALCVFKKSE